MCIRDRCVCVCVCRVCVVWLIYVCSRQLLSSIRRLLTSQSVICRLLRVAGHTSFYTPASGQLGISLSPLVVGDQFHIF